MPAGVEEKTCAKGKKGSFESPRRKGCRVFSQKDAEIWQVLSRPLQLWEADA